MGTNIGILERATAAALEAYQGGVAVMSFNPHSIALMAELSPGIPRGLTTSAYQADDWPLLPAKTRETLQSIPDFDRVGACFISHEAKSLRSPHVQKLRDRGVPILCWTIRSPEAEAEARQIADNVTFEGYLA
jgi:glycerophosphoryl diester phosphodiesterase